jgi:hypothetical protein
MDAFSEEDDRIIGHEADSYHRIDISPASSRGLVVRYSDSVIAETKMLVVLYVSDFAPRWYVAHANVDESAVTRVEQLGRIGWRIPRSAASSTWCRSSRTWSQYRSMAFTPVLSRVRLWFHSVPFATLPPQGKSVAAKSHEGAFGIFAALRTATSGGPVQQFAAVPASGKSPVKP